DSTLLNDAESTQYNLTAGTYYYYVEDSIKCWFRDTIVLREPPQMGIIEDTIIPFPCDDSYINYGTIKVSPFGGIGDTLSYDYDFYWAMPRGGTSSNPDSIRGPQGDYILTVTDANGCKVDSSYYIDYADDIIVDVNPDIYGEYNIRCSGESDGVAEIVVAGGTADYNLFVTDSNEDTVYSEMIIPFGSEYRDTVFNLPAGIYTFIASDRYECEGFKVDTLTEPGPVSITWDNERQIAGLFDISCYGAGDGSIIISIDSGHSAYMPYYFDWSGPDPDLEADSTDQNIYSLDPGNYQVIVWDSMHYCEDTAHFTLIEPSRIDFSVDTISTYYNDWNITCADSLDGFIHVTSNGGVLPHNYLWTKDTDTIGNSEQNYIDNLYGGTYHLVIRDSLNCYTVDTAFVLREPNPLGVIADTSAFTRWGIQCFGDSTGWIQLTPFGGADSSANTYEWSTSDGYVEDALSMNQPNLPEGTYSVRITDRNGCVTDSTIVLHEPPVLEIESFTPDSAYCFGTPSGSFDLTVTGGVPGYQFLWSPEGNMEDPTVEDPEGLLAGAYSVVVTDSNGCTVIASDTIFEGDLFSLDTSVSYYNGVPISCFGSSDGFIGINPVGGQGPYEFVWNTGDTARNLEGLPAGTYSVLVRDYYGCEDSTTIVLNQPDQLKYVLQKDDPFCYNDSTGSIGLMITGGTVRMLDDYQVLLNDVLAEPYITDLPAGQYYITIVDLNECSVDTFAELINPDTLMLSFQTVEAYCPDKADGQLSLEIEGGTYPYFITWDRGLTMGQEDFMDVFWGEYVATVTDANNCVVVDTAFVSYTHTSCLVIPNAFSPNGDGFNDQWVIDGLELYPEAEIRIFDRWGASIYYTGNAADEPWDGTYNGRELPIDSYHYIINLNNGEDPELGNVTIVR
ncbi:MAG: T9SS type B sorting domain-containing protein, partial [Bacteroidales bacterium]